MDCIQLNEETDEEMPCFTLRKRDTGSEVNYKAKLEHKLLLARQDPEPVFDLTDCNLSDVPSGVYSWCKVCRKEILLMQNNKLKSLSGGGIVKDLILLRVLNLCNNKLSHLPRDIGVLTNLQAFYLNSNCLKSLPESFSHLMSLQVLSLKGNPFKDFPQPICYLSNLKKLDISTTFLKKLPDSFYKLNCALLTLVFDPENYTHPPTDVCRKGLQEIMKYLCEEGGVEYIQTEIGQGCPLPLDPITNYTSIQGTWNKDSHTQDQHQLARIEIERSLQDLYNNLTKLTVNANQQKHQLLKELMQDQDRIDEKLTSAQHKKDVDKQKLLLELCEIERESNEAIEQLLKLSNVQRNTESLLEELEKDRREFEELFMQNESVILYRKEVLEAMEQVLENQYREYQMNLVYNLDRKEILAKTATDVVDHDRRLDEFHAQTTKEKKSLIAKLLEEEEYQKKAFAALLMKKDDEYWRLAEQISLIENELANLTLLEVRKQDLKMEFEKSILGEQREVLTRLLIQIMTQQDMRKQEFEKRLREIEMRRSQEQVDFWLLQCQRLMASKPEMLKMQEKLLDPDVKAILRKVDATEYVPVFAKSNLTLTELAAMTNEDLESLGINDTEMRQAILREIKQRDLSLGAVAAATTPLTPTAPSFTIPQRQMSLRARFETECVVCMERLSMVIFLHCGHVCCCEVCGPPLKMCPLCRTTIEQFLFLHNNSSAVKEV